MFLPESYEKFSTAVSKTIFKGIINIIKLVFTIMHLELLLFPLVLYWGIEKNIIILR